MSMPFHVYGVNLNHFRQALGSKNQKLLEQSIKFIEQHTLYHTKGKPKKIEKQEKKNVSDLTLFRGCLERIINTGIIYDFTPPWELKNKTEQDWDTFYKERYILAYSLEALFAQSSNFHLYSAVGRQMHDRVFNELKKSATLNNYSEKLWHYIFDGRSLAGEPILDARNYGYLTNAEVRTVLDSLRYFQTDEGIRQLVEFDSNLTYNKLQDDVEFIISCFEQMQKNQQDAFFITMATA